MLNAVKHLCLYSAIPSISFEPLLCKVRNYAKVFFLSFNHNLIERRVCW